MTPRPGRRAIYIAIEGIDGAGKSVFLPRLARRLRNRGLSVRCRHEPADRALGRFAQRASVGDPWAGAVLFTIDRYLALEALRRDLARSEIVLTDRSFWSTLAYQGSALSPAARSRLLVLQANATVAPDRVVLLDLPAESSGARLGRRGGQREPLERRTTLRRAARAYRSLARAHRWIVVDARVPTAEGVAGVLDRLGDVARPSRRR